MTEAKVLFLTRPQVAYEVCFVSQYYAHSRLGLMCFTIYITAAYQTIKAFAVKQRDDIN